jgi:FixJ family two-component response regulator
MAISEFMQVKGVAGMVSPATHFSKPRANPQRSAEVSSGSTEIVHLIAVDRQIRERYLRDLTLRGIQVRCFSSIDEYLQCQRYPAACIVCEIHTGDIKSEALQQRLSEDGVSPIIFLGAESDLPSGIRAMKAGALDFLIHPIDPNELCRAVEDAFTRHRVARQHQRELEALKQRYSRLTPREREVLALVVRGHLNKQVAGMLAISLVTVQIHRGHTMRKMRARSFAELVCMALKLRILARETDEIRESGSYFS